MLNEIAHFVRNVPHTRRMWRTMPKDEFLDAIAGSADEAGKLARRAALVADLRGDVLEIGCGTGRMFPHYPEQVRVTAIDSEQEYLRLARERGRRAKAQVEIRVASAESLPFPDASFDAAVCGDVLCAVRSVSATLREVKRVLRPGGRFRLIEHVRSDRPLSGLLMDALNPVWLAANGGTCNLNRRVERDLSAAGFELRAVESFQLFPRGFMMAFAYRWIDAVAPAGAASR